MVTAAMKLKGTCSLERSNANIDSIFKSRDISLPTKLHIVKAMVFPIVMYGCETWTIQKAEHWRIDAFELWSYRRLLQRRQWHPTPVQLPGKSHGQRSLVGYSPWGRKESDTTEQLHLLTSLSLWFGNLRLAVALNSTTSWMWNPVKKCCKA